MTLCDAVVRAVPVGHQHRAFANAVEQLIGQLAAATGRVGEHAHGRIRVGRLRPQGTLRLRLSAFFLQDLEGCFVAVDQFGIEQRIA